MNPDLTQLGRRIKLRRKVLDMKQATLAHALGISIPQMSAIENGKQAPGYKHICALCEELDVTPDFLMLGSMRENNTAQNIIDNLQLCSDEDIDLVHNLSIYLLERRHPIKHRW